MTVKAIVDALRAAGGYAGAAVYADGRELFAENIETQYARALARLLRDSGDARRVCVAARGFTFMGFSAGGYVVMVKLAGRFPAAPAINIAEPEFVDTTCAPVLLSKEAARLEAEAALRQFGLIGGA